MRLLHLVIRLFPDEFRREHAVEIEHELSQGTAQRKGRLARFGFLLASAFDLARAAARLRLAAPGDVPGSKRAPAIRRSVDAIRRDLRYSLRGLRHAPLTSSIIVTTLALGIGMNTAIFSVVSAVLLRPLAYEEPDRLMHIGARLVNDEVERGLHSGSTLRELRESSRTFADIAGVTNIRQNLTGREIPLQVQVGWASTNLFRLLGVDAAVGRAFRENDPPGTLVLSQGIWKRHFGEDETVLGQSVALDGHPYTIVGVLPADFSLQLPYFPAEIDVWKVPDTWWQNGDIWNAQGVEFGLLRLIGRLDPGQTPAAAQAELATIAESLRERHAELSKAGFEFAVDPLHEEVVGSARSTLMMLLGAVSLVLLIACANVTNLLLVRAEARRREIALRAALGCSRAGLVRLLVVESLVLAVAGGVAGLALGVGGTQAIRALRPDNLPRLDTVALDANVLAFAAFVALCCTVLFGLAPALGVLRRSLTDDMHEGRTTAAPHRGRLGRVLVVGQIGLSLVLLIGAGLLTTSLSKLANVDPGFDHEKLLTFAVSLPGKSYERPVGTDSFLRRLEDRIEQLPGVRSAGVVWPMPLAGARWANQYVAGRVKDGERAYALYRLATPGLFETLGARHVEGRTFGLTDPRNVAIVSRNLAEGSWPGESAIGRVLQANPWGGGAEEFRIVGVVDDIHYGSLREDPHPAIYFDSRGWSWTDWEVDVIVRTEADPVNLAEPIRSALLSMDDQIPMAKVSTMATYLDEQLAGTRFALGLVGLFAVVAGVLAVIGLYGVISYSVSRRTREIGVRIALGAAGHRILGLVLGQGAILAALGLGLGLIAAGWATRFLESFLFGVPPTDELTFTAVAGLLLLATLAACAVPAHRAARVDPSIALRSE